MSTGLIIGASGGIGAACARRLEALAQTIVLAGRRPEPLEELASTIANGVPVVADVADAEGRAAIVASVRPPLGWVVLAHGLPLRNPLIELDRAEIESVYGANLVGPTLLLAELLRLEWAEPKAIVVIGSISASRSLPNRAVYGASKAGIEHLARSLAAELGPAGFRVNIVAPGVIETPFLGEATEPLQNWVESRVPQKRTGDPDEVARVVGFLIHGAPPYLTGARIAVDGGTEAAG